MLSININKVQAGKNLLINKVNLLLPAPCLHMLMGRNGSGKSTLLRSICNLNKQNKHAQIVFNNNTLPNQNIHEYISFVPSTPPQNCLLNATEVVKTSHLQGTALFNTPIIDTQYYLKLVGMQHMAMQILDNCSDGEKQKIMIARALARKTPIICFDEPLAFLDYPARIELLKLLQNLAIEHKKYILISSHDIEITAQYAQSISLIAKQEHHFFEACNLKQAMDLFV